MKSIILHTAELIHITFVNFLKIGCDAFHNAISDSLIAKNLVLLFVNNFCFIPNENIKI